MYYERMWGVTNRVNNIKKFKYFGKKLIYSLLDIEI